MLKSNRNLGLSEAMIAAAREILEKKLTPAQEKNIDKNHNGKIDKGDFEILHKKKKMMEAKCPSCGKSPCMCESVKKEEVESVDEAQKRTSMYIGTAHRDDPDYDKKMSDMRSKAVGGHRERGRGPLDKYKHLYKRGGQEYQGHAWQGFKPEHSSKVDVYSRKPMKNEDVEHVNEGNPINKEKKNTAAVTVGSKNRDAQHVGSRGMRMDVADKIRGREKLSGKDRQHYGEDVEFSDAELEMIASIAQQHEVE